jgi:hypothetical protein
VLNLCRILYTLEAAVAASKPAAAARIVDAHPQWAALVAAAVSWRYGQELGLKDKALEFLDFTIDTVLQTDLYRQMQDELERLRRVVS